MTDPLSIAVAGAAAAVALAAGWFSVPATPELDGERWFKLLLATLFRGQVEHEGGEGADWERTVLAFVPYHPAGRLPEAKVDDPAHFRPPGLSLPGEPGLVEALARLDDREARWRRLYEDDASIDARLHDPAELGERYDPARLLGEGGGWDDVADWGAGDGTAFPDALRRRLPATWVLVGDGPELDALADEVPDTLRAAPGAPSWLADCLADVEGSIVLAATGDTVQPALRALVEAPGARDRLVAFLSVGGVIQGEHAEWMARWFTPDELDTERNRVTPYLSVAWVDRAIVPTGVEGLPVDNARFPEPKAGDLSAIEVVDLGILFGDVETPMRQVARAIWAVTSLWALTRQ